MTASQSDCIFCNIARGDLGVAFVHETELSVAFEDMEPLAASHVLIVPKQHITSVDAVTRDNDVLLGDLMETAREVARVRGIDQSGYRVVMNSGPDAGQTVFHLHLHVLGGVKLGSFGK